MVDSGCGKKESRQKCELKVKERYVRFKAWLGCFHNLFDLNDFRISRLVALGFLTCGLRISGVVTP